MKKIKKKNKKRLVLIALISALIIAVIGGASGYLMYIYKQGAAWDNLIYPGIRVLDIDMSGKTRDEALNLLKEKYGDAVLKKKINITASNKIYTIDYSKLNARFDIDATLEKAFSYGKDLAMFDKYKLLKIGANEQYNLTFSYDDKYVNELLGVVEKDINIEPVNASIKMVSSGKFNVTPDVKGYKLQKENLKNVIIAKINGELNGDVTIQAPIDELIASITQQALLTIETKISTYNTNFATSSYERSYNIGLSTKAINGKLVMPGETFSFNGVVGERTVARGYKEAPVIVGNKIESGLGGGICQVSSTLYNAILKAGIKSTERIHHTLPSSYVGLGFDATVDWGNLDYKFKNTFENPIFIEGDITNKVVSFNVYASTSLTKKTFTLASNVYETIPAETKTVDDPNLPIGQTVIEQKAYTGYKVKVVRTAFENGIQVGSEAISDDYYRPVTGIIKNGTKK